MENNKKHFLAKNTLKADIAGIILMNRLNLSDDFPLLK